jgi:dTDP-glucose 4,6-dehydratase
MKKEVEIESEEQRIRPADSEVERLVCNNSKISQFTEWKPQYNLKKGLRATIQWLEEHMQLYKSDLYNV